MFLARNYSVKMLVCEEVLAFIVHCVIVKSGIRGVLCEIIKERCRVYVVYKI